jgi:hypothetical protein
MQFFGLTPKDYPELNKVVDVWPENWPAVLFFEALGFGNWNMGPAGPVGLRYESFREVKLARGIREDEWPELFESIRILEAAALDEIHGDTDG